MAENTKIEWATHTFNPWIGCTKVSPACKNCYAERDMDHRYGRVAWGPGGTRVLTGIENWAKPVRWNMLAQRRGQSMTYGEAVAVYGKELPKCESHEWDNRTKDENNAWLREHGVDPLRRPRVFCASLADVFEDWQGPILNSKGERGVIDCNGGWWFTNGPVSNCYELTMDVVRQRLFSLIDATPNLDWLLLTKRPENIRSMYLSQHLDGGTTGRIREFMDESESKDVNPYFRRNVWLGTSVENQEYADERIPELLRCRDLSPVLFLSCEPLLGPVNFRWAKWDAWNDANGKPRLRVDELDGLRMLDWVIAGGESGPEARPTDPDWFRSLRDQCQTAGVPFLFKQWGEWVPGDHDSVKMSDNEVCPWNDKPRSDVIDTKQRDNSNTVMCRVGKVRAGRVLDGVTHDGFPVPFQQR
jgi:protein gp37